MSLLCIWDQREKEAAIFSLLDQDIVDAICMYGFACTFEDCIFMAGIYDELSPEVKKQAYKLYKKARVFAKILMMKRIQECHPYIYYEWLVEQESKRGSR